MWWWWWGRGVQREKGEFERVGERVRKREHGCVSLSSCSSVVIDRREVRDGLEFSVI